jgi:ElaB/YqjD/DUF883 family membrane-anchored ribosome-binding protein
MATTSDLAPGRRKPAASAAESGAPDVKEDISTAREDQLERQVNQLQSDLKAIAATLAKLGGDKVSEAKDLASNEVRQLRRQGQIVVDDVQEQAGLLEKQLKDTIREKPLTAVASAVGIGYILALLTRG